jgi:hypothetical protein
MLLGYEAEAIPFGLDDSPFIVEGASGYKRFMLRLSGVRHTRPRIKACQQDGEPIMVCDPFFGIRRDPLRPLAVSCHWVKTP